MSSDRVHVPENWRPGSDKSIQGRTAPNFGRRHRHLLLAAVPIWVLPSLWRSNRHGFNSLPLWCALRTNGQSNANSQVCPKADQYRHS